MNPNKINSKPVTSTTTMLPSLIDSYFCRNHRKPETIIYFILSLCLSWSVYLSPTFAISARASDLFGSHGPATMTIDIKPGD